MNKNKILKEILITLLSIYFSIAICFSVTESISYFSLIVVFIISFIILNIIFPKIVNLKLPTNKEKFNKKELIVYGLIIFVVLLFAFIAFYPAVLKAADTPSQWKEVQSGIYSNWHPFIHTFIFMKLPSLIYNSYASCAIFELIIVGAILLYFCYFLRKYFFNKKGTIITLLLVILNPTFIKMAMYIGKDGPFSYLLFLGTLLLIEIVLTKGEWINKNSHKILLIITSLGIMLVRHNGIANVFLMFVLLIIFFKEKRLFYTVTIIGLILFRFILYGPVYNSLNMSKDGGISELIGVPMNQIAYVYHQNVLLSKEDQKLLDDLAPKEKWEEKYRPANFNPFKFDKEVKKRYFIWGRENSKEIVNFYIKYGLKYPNMYIRSYMNVTSPIWKIRNQVDFKSPDTTFTILDSKSAAVKYTRGWYERYTEIVSASPLNYIFFSVGTSLFIIVFSIAITIFKKRKEWTSYLPFVLVLSNTLVIMLLITGEEYRFVYSQIICAVPLLIYALSLNNKVKRSDKND